MIVELLIFWFTKIFEHPQYLLIVFKGWKSAHRCCNTAHKYIENGHLSFRLKSHVHPRSKIRQKFVFDHDLYEMGWKKVISVEYIGYKPDSIDLSAANRHIFDDRTSDVIFKLLVEIYHLVAGQVYQDSRKVSMKLFWIWLSWASDLIYFAQNLIKNFKTSLQNWDSLGSQWELLENSKIFNKISFRSSLENFSNLSDGFRYLLRRKSGMRLFCSDWSESLIDSLSSDRHSILLNFGFVLHFIIANSKQSLKNMINYI